jgi:hypothetical protein
MVLENSRTPSVMRAVADGRKGKSVRRALVVIALVLGQATVVSAAPEDPSATGQCASESAQVGEVPPDEPGVSFPFQCPPPPPFRGEAP